MKKKVLVRYAFSSAVLVVTALCLLALPWGAVKADPPDPTPGPAMDIRTTLRPYQTPAVEPSRSDGRLLEEAPMSLEAEEPPIGALAQRTIYCTADATILQGYPSVNLGSTTDMWAGYDEYLEPDGRIAHSLIRCDISGLPSCIHITRATLKARLVSSWDYPNTRRTIRACRITSSWSESSVTWNNKPGYGECYGSASVLSGDWRWYDFDVSGLANAWYSGTYPNYGIMLRGPEVSGDDASWRGFGTRESSYDPYLVIEYDTNTPPTISGLPDVPLLANTSRNNAIDLWAYAGDAESPDSALTFTIDNTPDPGAGVRIDNNRYIDINPAYCWAGQTDVVIRVTDPCGLSDTDTFRVTVTSSAPTITPNLPDVTHPVNTSRDNTVDLWAYTNDAESPDSALTFTIDNTPDPNAGITIDGNRYVDINPAYCWTGQTDVVIRATDPCGLYRTDTFRVTVTNSAPIITPLPSQTLSVSSGLDNAIDLCAYASDTESPCSDLTFTIDNTPAPNAGVTIDRNRYVDINPASGWTGQTDVVIRVTDPCGLSATDTFSVAVTTSNSAPIITPTLPDQTLPANTSLDNAIDLWAHASDAESSDSELSFTIDNVPNPNAGVTIDRNRYVDINPASEWTGQTDVVIRVTDPGGLSSADMFSIGVLPPEPPITKTIYLPIILSNNRLLSTPVLNSIDNSDGDGSYAVRWSSVGAATGYILQEDDNSSFTSPATAYSGASTSKTITGKAPGTYYYRVQATNSSGSSLWSNVVSARVTGCSATVSIQNNCSCGLTITGMGSSIYVSANSTWLGTRTAGTYYVTITGSCIYTDHRTWTISCGFNTITLRCS